MRSKNFTERRKRIIAFTGIYAASIILLLFILSAFGMHFTPGDQTVAPVIVNEQASSNMALLHDDSLLHQELQNLQQSDFKYRLMGDSAGFIERNNAITNINEAEGAIKKTIDSIQLMTSDYTGNEKNKYSTMLSTFRVTLGDRSILKNSQQSVTTSKTMPAGNSADIMQWKNELLMKENDINRLQAEIKSLEDKDISTLKTSGAGEAQKGETELLRTAFNDQQKELDAIKDKYNRLKSDNNSLSGQLIAIKKNTTERPEGINDASNNQINILEQQIEGLNADLSFAKIDCNLARTDAQQMISNARQRKELLYESLSMLNSLAKSTDIEIQKKAKEKIIRLNRIATTLHD